MSGRSDLKMLLCYLLNTVSLSPSCSHPFIYFPSFYMYKGALEGRDTLQSLQRCQSDMWV